WGFLALVGGAGTKIAAPLLEEAMEVCDRIGHPRKGVGAPQALGIYRVMQLQLDEGRQLLERSVAAAEAIHQPRHTLGGRYWLAYIDFTCGRFDVADEGLASVAVDAEREREFNWAMSALMW